MNHEKTTTCEMYFVMAGITVICTVTVAVAVDARIVSTVAIVEKSQLLFILPIVQPAIMMCVLMATKTLMIAILRKQLPEVFF